MNVCCGSGHFLHLYISEAQPGDGATHSGQVFPPQIKICSSPPPPHPPPHTGMPAQIIISGVILNSAKSVVNISCHSSGHQWYLLAGGKQGVMPLGIGLSSAFILCPLQGAWGTVRVCEYPRGWVPKPSSFNSFPFPLTGFSLCFIPDPPTQSDVCYCFKRKQQAWRHGSVF